MVRNHSLLAEFLRNIVIVNVHSEPLEKEPAGVKAFFFFIHYFGVVLWGRHLPSLGSRGCLQKL